MQNPLVIRLIRSLEFGRSEVSSTNEEIIYVGNDDNDGNRRNRHRMLRLSSSIDAQ